MKLAIHYAATAPRQFKDFIFSCHRSTVLRVIGHDDLQFYRSRLIANCWRGDISSH